jgi:hypothetical protein
VTISIIPEPFGGTLDIRSIRSGNIISFGFAIGFCDYFEFDWFLLLSKRWEENDLVFLKEK